MKYAFRDIASNCTEKRIPTEEDRLTYIGLEHLDSRKLTITRYGSDVPLKGEKLVMKKGDILFGKRNTYLKRVAIAPFDGLFSAHGMVLRPNEKVISKDFFPFFLSSDYFLDEAIRISVGSLSPTVNWKDLRDLEFEIPDFDRQHELAQFLSSANELKESYEKMIVATEEMVKSQFISQFGFPQDGVEKYPSATIESLLQETISGEWGTDCSDDSGTKVIRTTNFTNEGVLDLTVFVVRTIDAKKVEKKQLKKGDIILEKSGGTKDNPVGRLVYFEEDGVFLANNFTQVLRPAEDINSRYLFAALYYLYQTHKPLIKGLGNQTNGIQNLKVPQYLQLQICVPDRTAQDDFERICRQADKSKYLS
jgi:type I restriction enzyme S subunit